MRFQICLCPELAIAVFPSSEWAKGAEGGACSRSWATAGGAWGGDPAFGGSACCEGSGGSGKWGMDLLTHSKFLSTSLPFQF